MEENRSLVKGKKLGEGVYGIVYQTTVTDDDGNKEEYALKRNLSYVNVKGIEVVRELNYLATLDHPLIVKLIEVSLGGDPFEGTPMTPTKDDALDDKCHFLLEKADCDLRKYLKKGKPKNLKKMKYLICQILLAIEYVHSKGIIHRDIKPDNILLKKTDNCYQAILTDFGLSCFQTTYRPTTPGTVSSWFRAPEISSRYTYYDTKIDVWALGALFFEMISFRPFVVANNPDRSVMTEINKSHPSISKGEWKKFLEKAGRKYEITYRESNKGFQKLILEKNKALNSGTMLFDDESGSLEQFSDLLDKMMKINPCDRITATEALNHPFFSFWKDYISGMREKYLLPPKEDKLFIHNCIERAWACNIALNIYNNRNDHKWYSHHIIFQALRLFDDHIHKVYMSKETTFRDRVTREMGKIYTYSETGLYFHTCIYLMIKFVSCLKTPPSWKKVFPNRYGKEKYVAQSEMFEEMLLQENDYSFVKPNFINLLDKEKSDQEDKEYNIRKALSAYCYIKEDYAGSINDLFEKKYNN